MPAGRWRAARMVACYSAGAAAENNATAKYLKAPAMLTPQQREREADARDDQA